MSSADAAQNLQRGPSYSLSGTFSGSNLHPLHKMELELHRHIINIALGELACQSNEGSCFVMLRVHIGLPSTAGHGLDGKYLYAVL